MDLLQPIIFFVSFALSLSKLKLILTEKHGDVYLLVGRILLDGKHYMIKLKRIHFHRIGAVIDSYERLRLWYEYTHLCANAHEQLGSSSYIIAGKVILWMGTIRWSYD